jgi:FAD:protein FMN transferase
MITLPTISALGTKWWFEIFDDIGAEKAQIIFDDLCLFIATFENKYSRFKTDSLISQLNTSGTICNPDQETIDLLGYGQELFSKTGGYFNLLVGEVLEKRGYDASYSFIVTKGEVVAPNPKETLSISSEAISLTAGRVDVGGYGKGYLIDLLAERMKEKHNLLYFLINGGGDIYATSDHGKPLEIYLEHPLEKNSYLETTLLKDAGFAASSTKKRQWFYAGKKYTHIVGAKDDNESDNIGVYVKAPCAKTADAFATTFLISSPNEHKEVMTKDSVRAAIYDGEQKILRFYGEFSLP